jgi:hypothetical protein
VKPMESMELIVAGRAEGKDSSFRAAERGTALAAGTSSDQRLKAS